MSHDPRQTIIEFLSAPLAPMRSPLVVSGDETVQRGTRSTSGGLDAIASTILFLKEREATRFYACIVTFTDGKGQAWEMVCLAQQDDAGNWVLRNGSGGAPHDDAKAQDVRTTRVELIGGPGVEGGFYAGGYVVGPDAQKVKRVQLVAEGGIELEDTVDERRVLFVTGQTVHIPIQVRLYINGGFVEYQVDDYPG